MAMALLITSPMPSDFPFNASNFCMFARKKEKKKKREWDA